ncbi:Rieske domain-containing protein-like [Clupea harengus]|uniref:Rieske domain-containing protein n=1 Tax=Clupea harengus TaxID=7950 RepID=A0A6P3VNF8_CLUHA|nr:Rieske domain-containing protein-like [Clupea harengus]
MFCADGQEAPTADDGRHCFGKREDIIQAKRVVKLVNGRDVLVLYHEGEFYALDVRCYHSGGNLGLGDIEEFGGRLCIVCPWHKYKITLLEGEGMYQPVDPAVKPPRPGPWRSKGVKQRVHSVTESDGYIYVTLNPSTEPIESDCYQTDKFRATLVKMQTQKKK